MKTSRKPSVKSNKTVDALKKQVAALKEKLRKAEENSEAYRKAYQALAIKQITPEQLREWDREVEVSGKTILDVLDELQLDKA